MRSIISNEPVNVTALRLAAFKNRVTRGHRQPEVRVLSLEFYKLLHLLGIFSLLLSLGGISLHMMNGGTRQFPHRKFIAILHGISLLLILVAGFGMLARLQSVNPPGGAMPGWVIAKLLIWLVLGGIPALFYRKPTLAKQLWFVVWILAVCAAYLALFKPF